MSHSLTKRNRQMGDPAEDYAEPCPVCGETLDDSGVCPECEAKLKEQA